MRTRFSLAVIVAAGAFGGGVAYGGGGPGAVYNDYAQDRVLSCKHSHADLVAALRSGSLNQYGDPLTLAGLKLAVRKQLAGGCRRENGSQQGGVAGAPKAGSSGSQQGRRPQGSTGQQGQGRGYKPPAHRRAAQNQVASAGGSNGSFIAGRGLIVGLLVAALAFGGWLTKHALAARD